jgi:hypothetical protein
MTQLSPGQAPATTPIDAPDEKEEEKYIVPVNPYGRNRTSDTGIGLFIKRMEHPIFGYSIV